jgi:uncharacterized membrane protein
MLSFGYGSFKEAAMVGLIAATIIPLMQGGDRAIFAVFLGAGGLLAMNVYKRKMVDSAVFTVMIIIIGMFLFKFYS